MSQQAEEYAHDVVLIAPNGKEQPAELRVTTQGVKLATSGGEVNSFPFEVIKKWLPSHRRSKAPGSPGSLDLQIKTDRGERDLRMRCADEAEVQAIIEELNDTVQDVMASVDAPLLLPPPPPQQQQQHQPPTRSPAGPNAPAQMTVIPVHIVGAVPAPVPVPAAFNTTAQQQQYQQQQYQQQEQQQQYQQYQQQQQQQQQQYQQQVWALQQQLRASAVQAPAAPAATSRADAAGFDSANDEYHDGGRGGGASPRWHDNGEAAELLEQNEFLEDLVKRLAAELSRLQSDSLGFDSQGDPAALAAALGPGQGGDASVPLPAWLRDRRFLNPLLVAYDERLADIQGALSARSDGLEELQRKVEEVIGENERLRHELSQCQADGQRRQREGETTPAGTAGGGASSERVHLLLEESTLLRHENDLLVSQANNLEGELARLQAQVEERAVEVVTAVQEGAATAARSIEAQHWAQQQQERAAAIVQASRGEVASLQAKLERSAAKAKAAYERAAVLEAEVQELSASLDDERSASVVTRRALEELRTQASEQADELAALRQRSKAALEGQAALTVELNALRERHESVSGEARSSREEADQLRRTLALREARLAEYQANDTQVYSQIKEAMEEAETARLARDASLSTQREAASEIALLKERLENVRRVAKEAAYSELQGSLHEKDAALRTASNDLETAEKQNVQLKAANERLARDVRQLGVELAGIRSDIGGGGASRAALMSLGAMEKIQELERTRDDALSRLDSAERKLERSTRDTLLTRQALDVELRDTRRKLAEAEGQLLVRRNEAAGAARQLEAAGRELHALTAGRARLEEEARLQASSVRAERDQEVRGLAGKLETTLASCNRAVADAERMIEAKEVLIARYREEASSAAHKLERAGAESRRSEQEALAAMAALRHRVDQLEDERAQLAAELGEARAAAQHLSSLLGEGDTRTAQLGMQLLQALGGAGQGGGPWGGSPQPAHGARAHARGRRAHGTRDRRGARQTDEQVRHVQEGGCCRCCGGGRGGGRGGGTRCVLTSWRVLTRAHPRASCVFGQT
ncbi:hypothetical protein FOA52_006940 [Chlamydomonas sp. UWO 241]|nr:hypothetical protein FOA52_006940 [Chlamydomonas sp. UWO 241]